jgi:hypothetical protein
MMPAIKTTRATFIRPVRPTGFPPLGPSPVRTMGPGAKAPTGGKSIEDTMREDGMKGTAVMTMAVAGAKTKGTEIMTSTD